MTWEDMATFLLMVATVLATTAWYSVVQTANRLRRTKAECAEHRAELDDAYSVISDQSAYARFLESRVYLAEAAHTDPGSMQAHRETLRESWLRSNDAYFELKEPF